MLLPLPRAKPGLLEVQPSGLKNFLSVLTPKLSVPVSIYMPIGSTMSIFSIKGFILSVMRGSNFLDIPLDSFPGNFLPCTTLIIAFLTTGMLTFINHENIVVQDKKTLEGFTSSSPGSTPGKVHYTITATLEGLTSN